MSAGQVGRVFEAFSQADSAVTRTYGGTGLGLAISRRLVRLMGGEIWVRSVPGEGSTFSFTVPAPRAPHGAAEAAEPVPVPPAARDVLAGKRALVVDDNALSRDVAREFLELAGMSVGTAGTGEQALRLLRRETFDVVLMDLHMPVMDGLTATRALRALPGLARLPVLAVTAQAQPSDARAALAAGMNGHLTKPIDEARLRAALVELLA